MTLDEMYKLIPKKNSGGLTEDEIRDLRDKLKKLEESLSPPQCSTQEFMNREYNL